jgi:hypothetical protein
LLPIARFDEQARSAISDFKSQISNVPSKLADFSFGAGLIDLQGRAWTSTAYLEIRLIWRARSASTGGHQLSCPILLVCALGEQERATAQRSLRLDIVPLLLYKGQRFAAALACEERFVLTERFALRLMEYNGSPPTDAFTQGCRDFLRSLTYEAILAFTVYAAPMLFMIGPAAIVANRPPMIIALHSLLGFGMSWTVHRMGHRLLMALPKGPRTIYLSSRLCLPVKLTVGQFVWMLEMLVAAGVFCGIAGKRFFATDLTVSLLLFAIACALYFFPVSLTRLWSRRYYPVLTLMSPPEDLINKSFPSLRAFFQR